MSTLNLALQNVSLMREKMDNEMEVAIKYKNNLAAIRSTVIDLLNERFSRMKLKGYQVKICPAATQDDIVDNFESVHFISQDG